ncbi:MAG: hypothetical protein M3P48_12030 [Actinomycetota bacterium]|nr:hypothetical protein [Actinomycetota bacterium]
MNPLEERLRQALEAAADDVPMSAGAWAENQERLRQRQQGGRRSRIARFSAGALGAAAAVAAAALVVVPQLSQGGGSVHDEEAGGGTATMQAGRAALENTDVHPRLNRRDGGLELCAKVQHPGEIVNESCVSPKPRSGSAAVAFDYFSWERYDDRRTVLGAVDERAARVTVAYENERAKRVRLRPVGHGYSAFGVSDRDSTTQFWVAYDKAGRVLQKTTVSE